VKTTTICMATALLAVATPAVADDTGFYLGAGAGQANVEVDDVLGVAGANFDEGDTGFKVFGGYRFLPWLGVEGIYVDAGSPSISGPLYADGTGLGRLGIDVKAFVAAAVFTLPLGDRFELFAKPGFAYWKADTSVYVDDPLSGVFRFSQGDDDGAFFIGAGAGFSFNEHFGLRLEYEWFEVTPKWDEYEEEFVQELDASASFLSASFVYRF